MSKYFRTLEWRINEIRVHLCGKRLDQPRSVTQGYEIAEYIKLAYNKVTASMSQGQAPQLKSTWSFNHTRSLRLWYELFNITLMLFCYWLVDWYKKLGSASPCSKLIRVNRCIEKTLYVVRQLCYVERSQCWSHKRHIDY